MQSRIFIITAIISVILVSCSSKPDYQSEAQSAAVINAAAVDPCDVDSTFIVWCGYKNPEDLAVTPDGEFLLATGFGGIPDSVLNEMSIIKLSTMQHSPVEITLADNIWGDPSCERTTTGFSTHGFDIKQRGDGRYMVAATNHLPEETIELFELLQTPTSWELVWRGCAESPIIESGARQPMFNDVALTIDGGFYATEMYNIAMPFDEVIEAGIEKRDTGVVWYWTFNSGFVPIMGSAGSFPNGIVINDIEDTLYVNYWFSGETIKLDLASGEKLATHQGGRADNLTMVDGAVWAAKHDVSVMEFLEACPADLINCFVPFSVYELDLEDLSEKNAWSFDSEIFGFGTVATPVGDSIWFGSAHGDRIARFSLKPPEPAGT